MQRSASSAVHALSVRSYGCTSMRACGKLKQATLNNSGYTCIVHNDGSIQHAHPLCSICFASHSPQPPNQGGAQHSNLNDYADHRAYTLYSHPYNYRPRVEANLTTTSVSASTRTKHNTLSHVLHHIAWCRGLELGACHPLTRNTQQPPKPLPSRMLTCYLFEALRRLAPLGPEVRTQRLTIEDHCQTRCQVRPGRLRLPRTECTQSTPGSLGDRFVHITLSISQSQYDEISYAAGTQMNEVRMLAQNCEVEWQEISLSSCISLASV